MESLVRRNLVEITGAHHYQYFGRASEGDTVDHRS